MTKSFGLVGASVLASSLAVFCAAPGPPAPPRAENGAGAGDSLELRNGRWFDGTAFSAPRTMYAVGGRLTAARPPRVGTVRDLAGGYVVPPFAEGHNHWLEPRAVDAYVAMYLRDGVFYLKDQANASVIRRRLKAALNRPTTVDFVSSNEGWTGPGGHPMQIAMQFLQFGSFPPQWTEKDLDRNVVNEVDSVSDVDSRWPGFLAGRPDFVKVFLLYSEEYEKRKEDPAFQFHRGIDPRLVPEIVRRAHAQGLRVSAHVYSAADFHNALAGGVDDVAHMPGTGYDEKMGVAAFRISEADARLAGERGVTVTTTLSWLGEQMGEDAAAAQAVLENVVRPNVALLKRWRVPILVGSDQFRQSPAPEAMLLSRLGLFSNAELLAMWCETTPRAIFPKRRIGRLDEGFEASLLVLDGNPLEDFSATARISLRVKQGVVLPEPAAVVFPELPGS
jgi:Amidohydrolase family